MGPPLIYPGEGGRRPDDVGEIIHHVCAGKTALWVGYLGGDPQHGADPGGVSPLGGEENHGEAPKVMSIWGMGITHDRGGTKGGGDRGVGGVYHTEAEHSGAVYFHPDHHLTLPGSGEAPGGQVRKMVVGE